MSEGMHWLLAFVEGVGLGLIFYGGLLWTVHKGVASKRPALWFLGSFLLRMSLTLIGFYFILTGHWSRLLIGLLGFVAVRYLMTRLMKPEPTGLVAEPHHAS